MALSNAERQAAFRARKRAEVAPEQSNPPLARPCADLEEEVRHLKAELAKRPVALLPIHRRPGVLLDEDYSRRPVLAVPKRKS